MAEEKKSFEIFENPDIISKLKDEGFTRVEQSVIGRAWGDKTKGWTVYAPVPRTDEEAKARYNCTIEDLIASGVQKFFTQVGYETLVIAFVDGKAVVETVDGKPIKQFDPNLSDEDIHEKLQSAVDNYEMGKRQPGKAKEDKATLSTLDAMAAEAGMTRVEFLAMLKAKHGA